MVILDVGSVYDLYLTSVDQFLHFRQDRRVDVVVHVQKADVGDCELGFGMLRHVVDHRVCDVLDDQPEVLLFRPYPAEVLMGVGDHVQSHPRSGRRRRVLVGWVGVEVRITGGIYEGVFRV